MNTLLTPIDKLEGKLKFWKAAGMTGIIIGAVSMTYVWSQLGEVSMLRAANRDLAEEMVQVQSVHDGMLLALGNQCVEWRPNYMMFVRESEGIIRCSSMKIPAF